MTAFICIKIDLLYNFQFPTLDNENNYLSPLSFLPTLVSWLGSSGLADVPVPAKIILLRFQGYIQT